MQTENIYPPVPGQDPGPGVVQAADQQPSVDHGPEHLAEQVAAAQEPLMPPTQPFMPPAGPSMPMSMPPVSTATETAGDPRNDKPLAVLEVFSVRGVEYGMMTIVLWIGALTLTWVVLNMLNGSRGFNYIVVPTSALVVCVPVFGWFFLRLKKAELADPSLRYDPSKRRWSQITQILAYTAVLINLIYFVYVVLQHTSSSHGASIPKAFANLVVILLIAGGILFYYWMDEHRLIK